MELFNFIVPNNAKRISNSFKLNNLIDIFELIIYLYLDCILLLSKKTIGLNDKKRKNNIHIFLENVVINNYC